MAGAPTPADGRAAAPAGRVAGAVRVEIEVVDRCPGCGVEVTAEAVRAGWKVRAPHQLHDPPRARGQAAPPLPRYPAALPRVPR